jgi:protease-4
MAADKIVAQPGTLTGSIGVISGKMLTTAFWDKIGVSWDNVHTSANASFWSTVHDYTPQQWAQLQTWLDRIYDDFTTKVAEGRGLPLDKVLDIAKGRVWTGEDAKALGMVDELGGFSVALRLVREAAEIPPDADIRLKTFPPPKTLRQRLQAWLFRDDEESHTEDARAAALARGRETLEPLVRLAINLGLIPTSGILRMPDLEGER